jgi:hypothetical protein
MIDARHGNAAKPLSEQHLTASVDACAGSLGIVQRHVIASRHPPTTSFEGDNVSQLTLYVQTAEAFARSSCTKAPLIPHDSNTSVHLSELLW